MAAMNALVIPGGCSLRLSAAVQRQRCDVSAVGLGERGWTHPT
jgi:hypothetical protein